MKKFREWWQQQQVRLHGYVMAHSDQGRPTGISWIGLTWMMLAQLCMFAVFVGFEHTLG